MTLKKWQPGSASRGSILGPQPAADNTPCQLPQLPNPLLLHRPRLAAMWPHPSWGLMTGGQLSWTLMTNGRALNRNLLQVSNPVYTACFMLHPGSNNLSEADDNWSVELTTFDKWQGHEQRPAAGKQPSMLGTVHRR